MIPSGKAMDASYREIWVQTNDTTSTNAEAVPAMVLKLKLKGSVIDVVGITLEARKTVLPRPVNATGVKRRNTLPGCVSAKIIPAAVINGPQWQTQAQTWTQASV